MIFLRVQIVCLNGDSMDNSMESVVRDKRRAINIFKISNFDNLHFIFIYWND